MVKNDKIKYVGRFRAISETKTGSTVLYKLERLRRKKYIRGQVFMREKSHMCERHRNKITTRSDFEKSDLI